MVRENNAHSSAMAHASNHNIHWTKEAQLQLLGGVPQGVLGVLSYTSKKPNVLYVLQAWNPNSLAYM